MPIILKAFLPAILSAAVFAINNGPLYLCNGTFREAHFETEYTALDQCTRWGMAQMRHNSFALRFQLTGKCENGILICYPGSLDPSGANSAYGLSPEIQFQVPNQHENEVGDQCLAYQKKCNKNKTENHCNSRRVWHGIRVSAPKALGGPLIELSIAKEKYHFITTQIFNIQFGNPRNLMTKVTDATGQEIKFLADDTVRKTYLARKVRRDVKLHNYTGLWMLGMDILPMLNRDKMQLHIVRDCGCEMHAWFVHPSDKVPPLRAEPPAVSTDCPANVTETKQFALAMPANIGRAIFLRQRLNKRPEGIVMRFGNEAQKHLLVLHVDSPPYGVINISSERTKQARVQTEEILSSGDGRQFKTFDGEEGGNEDEWVDKYLDVELAVHKYFYEVKVGDRMAVAYFPDTAKWWTERQMGNITRIEIAGDVYPGSIEEPKVKEKPEKDQSKRQSYSKRFDGALYDGDTIVLRGKTGTPTNPDDQLSLSFFLMHNSPAFNPYVSKVAWFLTQTNGTLAMGHYNFVDKYRVDPQAKLEVFKPNEPFEMRLKMVKGVNDDQQINISVFAPNRNEETAFALKSMTFRDINFINIAGTAELFEAPYIVFPKEFLLRKKISVNIFPLLVVGDSIIIEGKLRDDATLFKIELLHDSPSANPYFGNVVLQIVFNLAQDTMHLSSYTKKFLFSNSANLLKEFPSRIFPGEEFKIEIRVEFNAYKILVYGAVAAIYEHVLPPWAASFLDIHGHFVSISRFLLDRSRSIFCDDPNLRSLAVPFVVEIPNQRMLRPGDLITIRGTVTKKNALVMIALLNEAVETYNSVPPSVLNHLINGTTTMVGIIVTRAVFTTDLDDGKGHVEFAYNAEVEEHIFEPPFTKAQKFHLQIEMHDRPVFNLDGYGKFVFKKNTMPVWAIQYIRIEGDLELDEMPIVEFSSRKKGRRHN